MVCSLVHMTDPSWPRANATRLLSSASRRQDFLTQSFVPNPASPLVPHSSSVDGASVSDSVTLVSPSDQHYSAGGAIISAEGLIPTPAIRNGDRKFVSEIKALVSSACQTRSTVECSAD